MRIANIHLITVKDQPCNLILLWLIFLPEMFKIFNIYINITQEKI